MRRRKLEKEDDEVLKDGDDRDGSETPIVFKESPSCKFVIIINSSTLYITDSPQSFTAKCEVISTKGFKSSIGWLLCTSIA